MVIGLELRPLFDIFNFPGVMIGMGLGLCIGFVLRGHMDADEPLPNEKTETSDDEWNEDETSICSEEMNNIKLVLVARGDLKMGKGKLAAQVVVKTDSEESLFELAATARSLGLVTNIIQDAGRTQIAPGSRTVLAIGPGQVNLIDAVTGHLKLL